VLQNELIARATGESCDNNIYQDFRHDFMDDPKTVNLLPDFVRTCRDLNHFWGYIQPRSPTYAGRRKIIWDAFGPLLDYLEGKNRAPADEAISDTLLTFDPDGVHNVWVKALDRRLDDPDGAITSARTLLETVCKRILDDAGETYSEKDDLPALYNAMAKLLNLAPSQHSEHIFKTILGNCKSVVNSLGSLRNKVGDAHGRGGRPVHAAPRHAALAVNLAGSVATFLVETWQAQQNQSGAQGPFASAAAKIDD
jgi:hypothetical protein